MDVKKEDSALIGGTWGSQYGGHPLIQIVPFWSSAEIRFWMRVRELY